MVKRLGSEGGEQMVTNEDVEKLREEVAELRNHVHMVAAEHEKLREEYDEYRRRPVTWKAVINCDKNAPLECDDPADVIVVDDPGFNLKELSPLKGDVGELRLRRYCGRLDLELLSNQGLYLLEIGPGAVANMSCIGKFPCLQTLILHGTRLDNEWEKGVESLEKLREIVMKNISMLQDAKFLGNALFLDSITIENCPNMNAFTDTLTWPILRRLVITGTSLIVGNGLVEYFHDCVSLKVLRLGDCSAVHSKISLKNCKKLVELCLDNVGVRSTFEWGTELPLLRVLRLTNSSVTDADVKALSAFTTLEEVILSGNKEIVDISPLTNLRSLKVLDLSLCSRARIVGPVDCAPPLEKLLLRATAVTDECVGKLYSTSLSEVDLRFCSTLSKKTSKDIASLRNLRRLFLDDSPEVVFPGRRSPLETLGLCSGSASTTTLETICESATNLTCLQLWYCGGELNVSKLASPKKLRELYICGLRSVSEFAAIASLPELSKLILEGPFVGNKEIEDLSRCEALRSLCVRNAKHLTHVDPVFAIKTLEELSLSDCELLEKISADKSAIRSCVLRLCAIPIAAEGLKKLASQKAIGKLLLERCGSIRLDDIIGVPCTLTDCKEIVCDHMPIPPKIHTVRTPVVVLESAKSRHGW